MWKRYKKLFERSVNYPPYNAHVKEYAPYIRWQIQLVKPDIIVLGETFKVVKNHIFPELEHVCKRIHRHEDIIFIDTYHPAAITKSEGLYYQVLDTCLSGSL